ncbi:MAG: histidine phosphatase family protein [Planctomycetes bacterium]|nr:histidine phosphatase family protein [Planctomycetota bacterium]
MKVALIPCGVTEWRADDRLLGRIELSLGADGQQRCQEWVKMLRPLGLGRIFHSPDELATATATLIGRSLGVPTKPLEQLTEVDVGLWSGLTEEQLKARYASAHRELCEDPLNVSPPGGESLSAAASRVHSCLKKRVKPNGKTALGLVMRPFSFAMARCALGETEAAKVWERAQASSEPVVIDVSDELSRAGAS